MENSVLLSGVFLFLDGLRFGNAGKRRATGATSRRNSRRETRGNAEKRRDWRRRSSDEKCGETRGNAGFLLFSPNSITDEKCGETRGNAGGLALKSPFRLSAKTTRRENLFGSLLKTPSTSGRNAERNGAAEVKPEEREKTPFLVEKGRKTAFDG